MKIGGYQIIDLRETPIVGTITVPGVYDLIEGTNKAILISGFVHNGTEYNDAFVQFTVSGSDFVGDLYGYTMTITDEDQISVVEGSGGGSTSGITLLDLNGMNAFLGSQTIPGIYTKLANAEGIIGVVNYTRDSEKGYGVIIGNVTKQVSGDYQLTAPTGPKSQLIVDVTTADSVTLSYGIFDDDLSIYGNNTEIAAGTLDNQLALNSVVEAANNQYVPWKLVSFNLNGTQLPPVYANITSYTKEQAVFTAYGFTWTVDRTNETCTLTAIE